MPRHAVSLDQPAILRGGITPILSSIHVRNGGLHLVDLSDQVHATRSEAEGRGRRQRDCNTARGRLRAN